MPKIKIVATIGPASFNETILKNMARKGLSVIRVNTAHTEPGYITSVSKMIDKINADCGTKIGLMVDLKGPELRTGNFPNGKLTINSGKKYIITDNDKIKHDILINHQFIEYIDDNTIIAINDGKMHFRVTDIKDGYVVVEALDSGEIHNTSRVNIPGKYIKLGTMTDRDLIFLNEGLSINANFYALSFVQKKENVYDLQDYIYDKHGRGEIISKIETKSGYDNIKSIVNASDYIMVARGDLGVELPLKEVVMAQKNIIKEAHKRAIPTIVATQMLESMVLSDSPTRAEVSDVTNAILDNADALMLSEETAIGKYPYEAVSYLTDISDFVESDKIDLIEPENSFTDKLAFSISRGLRKITEGIDIKSLIAVTKSGYTAKMISAMRPEQDIYAVVTSEWLARGLNLMRGVQPVVLSESFLSSSNIYDIVAELVKNKLIATGEKTIIVSGSPSQVFGGTNDLKIVNVGKFIGRGYAVGKNIRGKIDINGGGNGNILYLDNYVKDMDYSKYDAILIKSYITGRIINYFIENKKTLLYNVELAKNINNNMEISIDSDTGLITYM